MEQQAWAQGRGVFHKKADEVQSIDQVENRIERHIRLVQEDRCRVLEQQV
jgi:hypothetical protein